MERASIDLILDHPVVTVTGPRPSDVVQAAWNTVTVAAVCDPPALPTAPRREPAETRSHGHDARHHRWMEQGFDHQMFHSSPGGMLLITPLGRVIDANPAFLAITGRTWRDVAGTRVDAMFGVTSAASILPSATMRPGASIHVARPCRHQSGHHLELGITVISLPDEDGATEALAVRVVDITGRREAGHPVTGSAGLLSQLTPAS